MSSQHTPEMAEMVAVIALGAVNATTGECADARAHLAVCAICQEEYRQARAAVAALGRSVAQPPPQVLREKILGSLPARVIPLPLRNGTRWPFVAAAAAVVLIAAGVFWSSRQTSRQVWAVTCTTTAQPCRARGSLEVARAGLDLRLQGLAPLPAGRQYQAWLIIPKSAPKPEPAFSPDANGNGEVLVPEAAVKGAVVAVTVEPEGGSRQPTTTPILAATIE